MDSLTFTIEDQATGLIREVAGSSGSLSPAVDLLGMVGPGFGEQVAGMARPEELFEKFGRHALDEIYAIDPSEVKTLVVDFIESLREQAPDGIKEFVAHLIESLREHAPADRTEFVDHLRDFLGPDERAATAPSHEFDTPVDEAADVSGSVTPEVALLQLTGSGSGEEFGIGEQIAAIALPDGLIENLSRHALDDIHAIDPVEVKEFVANLIESLREHVPDGIKEFVGNVIESLREHAPDGIKEILDHLTEFLGHDEPVAPAHSYQFDMLFDEDADTSGFPFPLGGALDEIRSIDPVEAKEFATNLIESLREHVPDGIKVFVGNVIESRREHAPDGIKEGLGGLIEFFGNDAPVTAEHPFAFDMIFDEITDNWGAVFPAVGLFEIIGSGFGEDVAAANVPEDFIHASEGFWLA